jgi:hypothetical protein
MKENNSLILSVLLIIIFSVSCKKDENKPNPEPTPITVGNSYQGGRIAYILQIGDPGYDANIPHGLIAATSDQSTSSNWGCFGGEIPGADGEVLGTGYQNTIDIMNNCGGAGIAANICGDLELGGYSDWYLPSKNELDKLYLNRVIIGGFAISGDYWSSTENNNNTALGQNFYDGSQSYICSKNLTYHVRAIRSF